MLIYILDLLGVFAFAFLGARGAKLHGFNTVGILLCAFLAALGGGTIRSLLLNQSPFYFNDHSYILTVAVGALAALALHRQYAAIRTYIRFLDAIGIVTFAFIGASAALAAQLGLVGSIALAALTACGGGVLCDLLMHTKPHALSRPTSHMAPALLTGLACWLGQASHAGPLAGGALVAMAFLLQIAGSYDKPRTLLRQAAASLPHGRFQWLLIERQPTTESD